MFGDFLALSMDVLINQATKCWFLSVGRYSAPLSFAQWLAVGVASKRPTCRCPSLG
jgi:pyruvate/2-oxoglutarate/acetoin dehydrogenase E1 component